MKKLILLFILLNLLQQTNFAQNAKIDSLLNVLKTAKEDTSKVNALNLLSGYAGLQTGQYDTAFYYAQKAMQLAQKLNFKRGAANSYNNIGGGYYYQGNFPEALKNHLAALKIREEIMDKSGIAKSFSNIGLVYLNQGNYPEALKSFLAALKIEVEIGNNKGKANSYDNIGVVYHYQGNYPEALKNHLAALKIFEEIGDKKGIASCYSNIGAIHFKMGNYPEALKNHLPALKIREEIGNKLGVAMSYNNIGVVYEKQGNFPEALKNFLATLKTLEEIGDKHGIATSYNNIGNVNYNQGNYREALNNHLASLKIFEEISDKSLIANSYNNIGLDNIMMNNAKEGKEWILKGIKVSEGLGVKEFIREGYKCLTKADSALGNYKDALENYKLFTLYKDSLLNEENNKQIAQMKTIYETEKKDAEIVVLNKDKVIQEKEITRQKLVRNGFVGGFGLTLLLAASIFFSLQQNKKKNKIITAQKIEVEEKNKHITESIQYALRIQTAILPPDKLVKEYLNNSFVLYLPKDIVAGDFYWMETTNKGVLFAACDCTGHGVPGAMVSVMCHNALNRAVREYGLTAPAQILDKVVDLVQDNFTKSDEEIQDGMDASLCAYYPAKRKLQWAGANNPLWIIRNNEIIEYKADKQPIGKYEFRKPYTNHEIELQEGDCIYVFSDGYADQFGEGDKKLTKKGLKNILLSMQDKTMPEQRQELLNRHLQWKGKTYQIDDICVIGVRV